MVAADKGHGWDWEVGVATLGWCGWSEWGCWDGVGRREKGCANDVLMHCDMRDCDAIFNI